jgi:hypothetical protein
MTNPAPQRASEAVQFSLEYKGKAVDAGRMSAREIGPAILGIGSVLERASELLYGPEGRLNVEVHADFEHGSFVVDFDLLQRIGEGWGILGPEGAKHVLEILFGSRVTATGVLGMLLRRKVSETEATEPEAEQVPNGVAGSQEAVIQSGGGLTINAGDNATILIARDPIIARGLDDIAAPVRTNPGIDSVAFYSEGVELERIRPDDAQALKAPEIEPDLVSTAVWDPVVLGVAVVPLLGKSQWKFVFNDSIFPAPILDQSFLTEARQMRFGVGDALVVSAEVTTTRRVGRMEQSWKILKVHEHLRSGEEDPNPQLPLLNEPPAPPRQLPPA